MTPDRKAAQRACPVCAGREAAVLHRQRLEQPAGSPLPDQYDVVACIACGMVYADTAVGPEAYDLYYAAHSKYEDPAIATGSGRQDFDRARLDGLAERIAASARPGARIIDVGCAGGGLLAALRRRGYTALHGVDASAACVERVRAMGIEATQTGLATLPAAGIEGPFDVAVMSHVLEHVREPRTLLAAVAGLLAPRGLVYAETPDAARYGQFPFVPYYFFDSEHINHFDGARLATLGAFSGLTAVATGQVDFEVGPGMAYPACWIWLAAGTRPPGPVRLHERGLPIAVARYIDRCRSNESWSSLERLATSGRPVIVWGAGSFAQRLFGASPLRRCNVVAVVDRDGNKQGIRFAGFVVQPPETAMAARPDALVVIAAAIHGPAIVAEVAGRWPEAQTLLLATEADQRTRGC